MYFLCFSSNIKLHIPYSVDRSADEVHSTYLDTAGRTVLVIHKEKLVEQHIQDFQVNIVGVRISQFPSCHWQ